MNLENGILRSILRAGNHGVRNHVACGDIIIFIGIQNDVGWKIVSITKSVDFIRLVCEEKPPWDIFAEEKFADIWNIWNGRFAIKFRFYGRGEAAGRYRGGE